MTIPPSTARLWGVVLAVVLVASTVGAGLAVPSHVALDGTTEQVAEGGDPAETSLSVGQQFSLLVTDRKATVGADVAAARVEADLEDASDGQAVLDARTRELHAAFTVLTDERAALVAAFREGDQSREAFVARLVELELRLSALDRESDRLRAAAAERGLDGRTVTELAAEIDASSSPVVSSLVAGIRADRGGTVNVRVDGRDEGVRLSARADDDRVRVQQSFETDDGSTAVLLSEPEAVAVARDALLLAVDWRVERVDLDESDGVYEIRFVAGDAEARTHVDASSGALLSARERLDAPDDDDDGREDDDREDGVEDDDPGAASTDPEDGIEREDDEPRDDERPDEESDDAEQEEEEGDEIPGGED